MDDIELQVKKIISTQLGSAVHGMPTSTSFVKDLGADSLDLVSLLLALEEGLGIEISDESATRIKTIQDAIDFCQRHKR